MRKKGWIEALLTKRPALEKAIDAPLGAMLGCGHFGCVFESTPPWVVKFSIDPTEGPIWSKIVGLVKDEAYGDGGFPEIRSITRILPDIQYGGRKKKVWAIVREAVAPVYKSDGAYTDFSLMKLGRPAGSGYFDRIGTGAPVPPLPEDFSDAIYGLAHYQGLAREWHKTHSDETEAKIERILNRNFHGGIAGPLGESLSMLASNRVFLRDVHRGNIGWHVAAPGDGDDWDRLVIFDPGHTPTGPAKDIPEALVANGRSAL
jgi:hypothetical protein